MKQRILMALAMSAIVGGCATPAPEGVYVSLLRDAMAEAARVAEEPSGDSAGAVRAVEAWRTGGGGGPAAAGRQSDGVR